MADIDALIASTPSQIQNNALRSAQIAQDQQKIADNALSMQENQAGTNALRQIYADPNSRDPRTGMPTPGALGPLAQASPEMYMNYMGSMAKIGDAQSRANLTNLKINSDYNDIIMKNVVDPIVQYDQELQQNSTITPDQRKIMVEQKRKQLLDQTQNKYALPDSIRLAADIPFDNTWEFRSDVNGKRKEILKDSDRTVTYPDPVTGKPQKKTIVQNAFGNWIDPNSRLPFTFPPGAVLTKEGTEGKGAGAASRFLPAPLEAEVKKEDGTSELRSVRQKENPDGTTSTTYASGKEVGQEVPADRLGAVRPASAARARSAAAAFINKYSEEHPDATSDEISDAAAKFAVQQGGAKAFLAGGKQGDSVRFIGNVVGSHLPTLENLATALQNNNSRALNALKNVVGDQFGWTGPVDFGAAKSIVGGEIVKAIQGYNGAEADRDRVLSQLANSRTPDQLHNVIYTMRSLMAGQLAGLYRQAKVAGVKDEEFNALLPDSGKAMLQKELGVEKEQGKKEQQAAAPLASSSDFVGQKLDKSKIPNGKTQTTDEGIYGRDMNGKLHFKRHPNDLWGDPPVSPPPQ